MSFYVLITYMQKNDRNKSEEVSKQILADLQQDDNVQEDTTTKNLVNDVLIVTLNESESNSAENTIIKTASQTQEENVQTKTTTINNVEYTTDSRLKIPSLGIDYPVLSETSDELLKISLNKYWGNGANEVGNYCIVGHNYANGKLFGKLSQMEIGDTAILEDMKGRKVTYEAYKKEIVDPTDVSCTSQLTNGRREITLITCKNYGTQRLVIKCREI